ncbi:MAG: peptidase domain-containing ABC transporter [Balneola sp.]
MNKSTKVEIKAKEKFSKKKAEKAFIHQRDQSDCGVTCLASLAKFFGGETKVEQLRELSGTTKQGTTLLGLFQAANQIGLDAEAFEADIENLKQVESPCILHIVKDQKLQHYVICYGHEEGNFFISDPAVGVKTISEEKLDEQWQSKALLLVKSTSQLVTKKEKNKERWSWIKELVKEDIEILGLALALGIFITVLSLSTAIFSQKLIDVILPNRDFGKLVLGSGFLIILLVGRSGLSYIRQLFLIRQSKDFNNRIIHKFYGLLLKLPIPFFQNRKTGDLIARMNDAQRLQRTVTFLFANVMIDVLMILVASVYIMSHSYLLGGFILFCVPVYFFLTWYYNDSILDGQKLVMTAHSANESNYVDNIQGVATIKTSNKEPFFTELTKTVYGFFQDKIFDLGKVGIKFGFWADIIGIVFVVSMLLFSSMMVLNGEVLIGGLVAIFQMTSQLIPSANELALTNIQIQEARVAFERMYEFASMEPERNEKITDLENFKSISLVEVDELSFRFPGRTQLLKEVSFSVQKGEMISLLGESGCGKTTLLQILQRFYKPESGTISVNSEIDLKEIPVRQWRTNIASVSQQVKIFNGTLLDNICLGDSQEEAKQVVEFCKECGFDTYFEAFPQHYLTLLGEEGVNISGGQQQLVALARALYQKPELLLLDEATSAMDRNTEQKILQLLMSLKEKMSIILVTHRVQSAKLADRIYVIEEGKITAKGTPKKLTENENLFSASLADISI